MGCLWTTITHSAAFVAGAYVLYLLLKNEWIHIVR